MINEGYCRYGEACHFYHNEIERRNLIDTLPDLPDGVLLPPMPQWIRNQETKCDHYYNNGTRSGSSEDQ